MNYILEIKAFYDWLEVNQLPTSAIALWHGLMHMANKTGWKDNFTVAVVVLEIKTGLKKQAIINARTILQNKGLITFKSRGGNQSATYTINSFVSFKETQNDTQSHTQEHTQSHTQEHTINKLNETKQNETKEKESGGVDTPTPTNEKKIKCKYGEYGWVMLTDAEYNRLIKEYGDAVVKHYIQYIDESAQQTGNKNKWRDWNLTVRKAIRNKWGGGYSDNFNNTEKNYDDDDDFLMR